MDVARMHAEVKALIARNGPRLPRLNRTRYGFNELLSRLSPSGCASCHEESRTLKRFFFWYLHEGYAEPENLTKMERSLGFCHRHARTLLEEGAPHNVVSAYGPLVSFAVERLRSAERGLYSEQGIERAAISLTREGPCPACESEAVARAHLSFLLRTTLHEAGVREAIDEASAPCLPHFLDMAGSLDWEQLRFLLGKVVKRLEASAYSDAAEGINPLPETLWGRERGNLSGAREHATEIAGEDGVAGEPARATAITWSPSLALLRRRIGARGCPACRAEQRLLRLYLDWLSAEVREHPQHQWTAALHLCVDHAWQFARRCNEESLAMLADAVRSYWLAELGTLAEKLRDKPSEHLALRLSGVPGRVRRSRSSNGDRRALRAQLWVELQRSLRSPKRVLSELLKPAVRPHPCPACTGLETAARRTCDLLVRGLADPGTLRLYWESDGICFHHLPLALTSCREPAVASSLLRTQRSRMDLLQWELHEYTRKQNWTLRYEPRDTEQNAWRRALRQFAGV